MIKTIIFDFDGVIVDSVQVGFEANQKFCQKMGKKIFTDINDFKSKLSNHWPGVFLDHGISLETIRDTQVNTFQDYTLEHQERIKLLENMESIIKELSQKYKLAIVSFNYQPLIESILKRHNLLDHFSYIVDGHKFKSKSEGIKDCLNKFNIQNHEAIFIGDMVNDIFHGRDSNVKTIILHSHSWNHKEDIIKNNPDILIDNTNQILEVLKNDK
ncbi:HAD family hydrolase [Nanoarchaeota archaeon]